MSKANIIFRRIKGRIVPIINKGNAYFDRGVNRPGLVGGVAVSAIASQIGGIRQSPIGEFAAGSVTGAAGGVIYAAIKNIRRYTPQLSQVGKGRLIKSGSKGLLIGAGIGTAMGLSNLGRQIYRKVKK